MRLNKQTAGGFTLIEMLLLGTLIGIVLISGIIYNTQRTEQIRIARTVRDMQQILDAALMYRLKNSQWPKPGTPPVDTLKCLKGIMVPGCTPDNYLPKALNINPWQQYYGMGVSQLYNYNNSPVFYVWTAVTQPTTPNNGRAYAIAQAIAGDLPLSFTTSVQPYASLPGGSGQLLSGVLANPPQNACKATTGTCYVVAAVNLPGENIGALAGSKNANAVAFAGIYHHGGCVPVPTCIKAGDIQQIFVAPTSVSGVYQGSTAPNNLYKINSFTAYAKSPAVVSATSGPDMCDGTPFVANSCGTLPASTTQAYWRVCLQVITEAGAISNNSWGQYVSLMAVTRCSPQTGEPAGSNFAVFNN